jgi:hypothetical protein
MQFYYVLIIYVQIYKNYDGIEVLNFNSFQNNRFSIENFLLDRSSKLIDEKSCD